MLNPSQAVEKMTRTRVSLGFSRREATQEYLRDLCAFGAQVWLRCRDDATRDGATRDGATRDDATRDDATRVDPTRDETDRRTSDFDEPAELMIVRATPTRRRYFFAPFAGAAFAGAAFAGAAFAGAPFAGAGASVNGQPRVTFTSGANFS